MAGTGIKGVDVVQTGTALVFEVAEYVAGVAFTAGPVALRIVEVQNDSTIKTYDFTTNTFKTSSMSNGGQSVTMTNRPLLDYSGGDASLSVGLWTYALTTLTGFTIGNRYIAFCIASGVDTPIQPRKFQYGSAEGDLVTTAISTGTAALSSNKVQNNGVSLQTINGYEVVNAFDRLQVSSSTSNTVTVTTTVSNGANYVGHDVTITNATDLFDTVVVTGFSAPSTFTVHRNWRIANPDNTSIATFRLSNGARVNTSGNTQSDLQSIFATALSETNAGQLAAAFKKLFDVVTPVLTAASVNQSGDNFARLGAPAGTSISADIAAVNVKTTNLPASPASTTNITAGTITTVSGNVNGSVGAVTGNIGGNVTGSVASVVGNVGGNVTGSVGSVVGAVGSVTGNVGGNVVGSVGSVTGNVGGTVASVTAGVTVTTNNDKTGYSLTVTPPSTTDIANTIFVDGTTNKLKVNSDHSVNATVSSGGAATPEDVQASTDAIIAEIAGLGSDITVVSPLSEDGTELVLVRGDSYTAALDRAISFSISGQAGLIGTVPHLRIATASTDLAIASAVVSGTQTITFSDITAAQTTALQLGAYPYQIRFMDGSDVATLIEGMLTVKTGY